MSIELSSDKSISTFLAEHPDWQKTDSKLARTFKFKDFVSAFGFMSEMASIAEAQNHHPEWCNVYSKVSVQLVTHKAGGITKRDFRLAEAMDVVAKKYK